MTSTVAAALAVLEHVAVAQDAGVNEIARALAMPPSRVHRLLQELRDRGYVVQAPATRRYRPAIKLFELGTLAAGSLGVRDAAYPEMKRLIASSHESVNLGMLDRGEVLYLERIATEDVGSLNLPVGRRVPAHATALGKALLAASPSMVEGYLSVHARLRLTAHTIVGRAALRAELEATLGRGWAIDDEEFAVGFRCVAAAIRGPAGQPLAALSVSAPTARADARRLERLGVQVASAAARISKRLAVQG